MFFARTYRIALAAAAEALERAEFSHLTSSVKGELRGFRVKFHVVRSGWRVIVYDVHAPVAFAIRPARLASSDAEADFDADFRVTGGPRAAVDELLTRRARSEIARLGPQRIELAEGRLVLDRQYSWYFAEPADIRLALEIATRLAREASKVRPLAPKPQPMQLGESPYRQSLVTRDPDAELRGELARAERAIRRDRRVAGLRRVLGYGVIAFCVVVWPAGLMALIVHGSLKAKRARKLPAQCPLQDPRS